MNNYKIKLLDIDNDFANMIFSLNNKREYINCAYYNLILNDNSHLNIIFEANIYNFNPNKKVFLQINKNDYNNYINLIDKIKSDIGENIIQTNSLYVGRDNKNNYILAEINKSKNNIYTKLYKLNFNKYVKININEIPNNFKAIITIRIKSLLEKNDDWMLNNEIYQMIIKKEIISANDEPDDLDIINYFL